MKKTLMAMTLALLTLAFSPAQLFAEDAAMAAAMAKGGVDLANKGKTEQAKDMFFKALALDADCPEALYEMGKIYETEGNSVNAGDFFARAVVALANDKSPSFTTKKQDAQRRLQKLNPYAPRLTALMEDYAANLDRIAKKVPDSLTREEALHRIDSVGLSSYIAPEKMPKIERPAPAKKPDEGNSGSSSSSGMFSRERVVKTVVPPEVERALKSAGWETITGVWTKKSENVYEVTDGRLEAKKTNGIISFIVHKGGTGVVRALVRASYSNSYYSYDSDMSYSAAGFGFAVKGVVATVYGPIGGYFSSGTGSDGLYEPQRDVKWELGEAPKNMFTVQIDDSQNDMKMLLNNGAKNRKFSTAKISKTGPFLIDIHGTATIEMPMVKGR